MEFQLIKQAAIGDYILPRIGVFADFLQNEMVETYQDSDSEHPELAGTAAWLAEHYFGFDPELKLFTSMSGRSIEDNVNRKVLKFTSEDLESLKSALADASIPLDTKTCKTLLDIVVTESVAIFFAQEIRSNPELMFSSKIDGSDVMLIRTAAAKDDPLGHEGPGRKLLHTTWRPTEAAAPTVRDMRDIYSMMAYNSAFNALVGGRAMGVHKILVHGYARDADKVLLSQLAINFETSQYFDASLKAIDRALKQGKKIKMKDGTPITPNPSIGPFFGTDYRQVLATEDFSDFAERKGTGKSILQFISSGQDDKKGRFLPYAFVSRKSLYGDKIEIDESGAEVSAKEDNYVGVSAKVSMKTLSSRYNGKFDQMHADLQDVLLRGFETHVSLMKANGIPLAKFKNLIPALQDVTVFEKVEESLVNILSAIPSKFKSFDAAKATCEAAVTAENAKIGQLPAFAKAPGNFAGFVDYVAQVVLKLPIQFGSAIKTFNPSSMLRPSTERQKVPAGDIPRSDYIFSLVDEGSRDALLSNMTFDEVFSSIVSSSGHGSAGTYAYNQLAKGDDFFDLCARFENAPVEKDRKNPKDLEKILNKLKYLNDQLKKATQKGLGRSVGNIGGSSIKNIFSQFVGNPKLASVAFDYLFAGALKSISASADLDLVALRKDIEANNINSPHLLALVSDIASKLPSVYNVEDESRIISDFDGAKVYSVQAPELYRSPTSAVMSRTDAAFHLAFEGSFNNAMHSMLSNGMVARYSQNASEFKSYVEANYSRPEITDEDADRVLSISQQVKELTEAGVLEKFIQFDESEQKPMVITGLKVIPDKEARRLASVSMKFQKFFQRNSKTSIVATLKTMPKTPTAEDPRTTFGEDYFDAFCVALSDKFYVLLGNHVEKHLEDRNIGARAGVLFDSTLRDQMLGAMKENFQGEEGEANPGQDMDSAAGRYSGFAEDWATRPRFFKTTGGFDTQSLAGFLSECLVKQDIAKLGGEEGAIAAKFISRITIPPNSKRYKNPLSVAPVFKLVQNRALWAFGKITQDRATKNINKLLIDNLVTNNGNPTTMVEAQKDVGIFVDPIVSIRALSKGMPADTKAKALMRAIARTGGNFDLYTDWAADMKAYISSYRKEVESSIANMAIAPEDKAFLISIIDRSISDTNFALSNKEKERLISYSEAFKAKFIKYEVLWKEMFNYKKAEIEEILSGFLDKTKLPFVGKVVSLLQENFRIKSIWDKEVGEIVGPGGLATIERDELHGYSVDALRSILFDNLDLANALVNQPLAIDEIADELDESVDAVKEFEEETDFANDAALENLNINDIISSAASASDKASLVAAVKAAAPDYDEVISDAEVTFDDKLAYIKKIYSRNFFFTSKEGKEHLKAELITYIKSNLDDVLEKSDNEVELTPIEKEIEAAGDLKPKSPDYIIKFSKAAPTLFKQISDDIVTRLATIAQSVVDASVKIKEMENAKVVAKAYKNLQSMTSHLAGIQRLVSRGKLIASARAPRLPAEALYKAAIEQFINFTESKIKNWNDEIVQQAELKELVIIDDDLRKTGTSLDKLSEGELETRIQDINSRVFASDYIVKQLFATRTMMLERMSEIEELRAQLAKINISKLQKFQEKMQASEKNFEERHELGADLIVEEEEVVEEPKVLVKQISDIKDVSGKDLTKDEVSKRKAAKESIKRAIAGLTALVAEGEPKITKWFANAGSTFARLILDFVEQEDFISKHTVTQMTQIQNWVAEVIDHIDAIGFSPNEKDEEDTITFMQEIANKIESIGNPSPDRTDVEIKILPSEEDELLDETGNEAGATEIGSDENEDLNAEVDASLIVLEKAQKEAKTAEIAAAMKNAYMFVKAFSSENRSFKPGAYAKTLAGVLSQLSDIALSAAADPRPHNLNKFKVRQVTDAFNRLVAAGYAVKEKPTFSDVIEDFQPAAEVMPEQETGAIDPAVVAMNKFIFDAKDFEDVSEKFIVAAEDSDVDVESLIELRFAIMQLHKVMSDAMKADQGTFANMQNVNQLDTHVFTSLGQLASKLKVTPSEELMREVKTLVDAILPKAELFANYLKMHIPKRAAVQINFPIRSADGWIFE